MTEKCYVYFKDTYCGTLEYERENDYYSFTDRQENEYIGRAAMILNLDYDSAAIKTAISERMMPEERVDVSTQLQLLGLDYYDTWEIFRRINGVHLGDLVWVSFDGKNDGEWFWEHHGLAARVR